MALARELPRHRRRAARDADPSGSPEQQVTVGRLLRSAPRPVWLLVLLHGLLVLGWSVFTPQFHAPDEPNHVEAVMRLETGQGWGRIGQTFVGPAGVGAIGQSPFGTPALPYQLTTAPIRQADSIPRAQRPSWTELGRETQVSGPGPIQQVVQHPPGYYWLAAGAVALTGGAGQPWDRAVGVMRVLSALLVAPLPLLAWAATFRLTGRSHAGIAAAVFPLAVPQLSHIGGAVNNDNLLTLTGGLVTVGLACALRGDRSLRLAAFTGVSLGIALFTKSLALALLPLIPLAYLVPWAYERRRVVESPAEAPVDAGPEPGRDGATRPTFPDLLRPVAAVYSLAFVLGGWWYAVNILRYGAVQPQVPGFPPGKFLGHDNAAFARYATEAVLARYWGNFGWFEAPLPLRLTYVAGAVVAVLLASAFLRGRRPRGVRWGLLVLLGPTAITYALMVAQAASSFLSTGYYSALAGRYLFVGVVGTAAVVGLGATAWPPLRRWAPLLLLVGAGVMQGIALRIGERRWWLPPGGGIRQVWGALSSWSPWPPWLLELLAVGASAVLVLTVVSLVPAGRTRPAASVPTA